MYYNIIPIILIDIFLILFFEGLMYFVYALPLQQTSIGDELYSKAQPILKTFNEIKPSIYQIYDFNILNKIVKTNMRYEQDYLQSNNTIAIVIFSFTLIFLFILFILYVVFMHKYKDISLDWNFILFSVFITLFLIMILELIFVFVIMPKKQFNNDKINLAITKTIS